MVQFLGTRGEQVSNDFEINFSYILVRSLRAESRSHLSVSFSGFWIFELRGFRKHLNKLISIFYENSNNQFGFRIHQNKCISIFLSIWFFVYTKTGILKAATGISYTESNKQSAKTRTLINVIAFRSGHPAVAD